MDNETERQFDPKQEILFPGPELPLEQIETDVAIVFGDVDYMGTPFSDLILTSRQMESRGIDEFDQAVVNNYFSYDPSVNGSVPSRLRTLEKPDCFTPRLVLNLPVTYAARHGIREGIHEPGIEFAVIMDSVSNMLRTSRTGQEALQVVANGHILEKLSRGESVTPLPGETVEEARTRLALEFVSQFISPEEIEIIRGCGRNLSGAQAVHDQHTILRSLGGKSQRPMYIATHWLEHNQCADMAATALDILRAAKEEQLMDPDGRYHGVDLDLLIYLNSIQYVIHAQSAEILRNSGALAPSLSNEAILAERTRLASDESVELEIQNLADRGYVADNDADKLFAEEVSALRSAAKKISENAGRLKTQKELDEEAADDVAPEQAIKYTEEERGAINKLGRVCEAADRDWAVARLRLLMMDPSTSPSREEGQILRELIRRLYSGNRALRKEDLNNAEYLALVELSKRTGEDILRQICLAPQRNGTRPGWDTEMDVTVDPNLKAHLIIRPYDTNGISARNLYDVLVDPSWSSVIPSGRPASRRIFTSAEMQGAAGEFNAQVVYGELRVADYLDAQVAETCLREYLRQHGKESNHEVLTHLFPEEYGVEPPSALQNVDRAAAIIFEIMQAGEKVGTIGDCDQDGFFSSMQWAWFLRRAGIDVDQVFQTRLDGHNVESLDLLNLTLKGDKLILINDTGSSASDVEVFQRFHDGISSYEELLEFNNMLEDIEGIESLSRRDRANIKRKITSFAKDAISMGREYDANDVRSFLSEFLILPLHDEFDEVIRVGTQMSDVPGLSEYVWGQKDVRIVVNDHHSASIEGVEFFRDAEWIVMVNPQWVREGMEDTFIAEMSEALIPDEEGHVDVRRLSQVQRKYECYPDSDLVGAVTSSKVLERVMQLYRRDDIVHADASELFYLPREKRQEAFGRISEQVARRLPTKIGLGGFMEVDLSKFWARRGARSLAKEHVLRAQRALIATIDDSVAQVMESGGYSRAMAIQRFTQNVGDITFEAVISDFENRWGVTVLGRDQIARFVRKNEYEELARPEDALRAIHEIDSRYTAAIDELRTSDDLTHGELRFYLSYNKELPKSYWEKTPTEKRSEFAVLAQKVAEVIDEEYGVVGRDGVGLSMHLQDWVKIAMSSGSEIDVSRVKRALINTIDEFYKEHGHPGSGSSRRQRARYDANKMWHNAIGLLQEAEADCPGIGLTDEDVQALDSGVKFGFWSIDYMRIARAIAQIGDGGDIMGPEPRRIVREGMQALLDYSYAMIDPRLPKHVRRELKRQEPEYFRILRDALRGTRMGSVNWNTRAITHFIAALVNANYRFALDGEYQESREWMGVLSKVAERRSVSSEMRKLRHQLPPKQEDTIDIREKLIEELVKKVKEQDGWEEKSIIVVELEGDKYVHPIAGLRGLVAGQLAERFKKPVAVTITERKEIKEDAKKKRKAVPAEVSVSFRLPGEGNVDTDMVLLDLEKNQVDGVTVLRHGGHPQASGGTLAVTGGMEVLEDVLTPYFKDFKLKYPDRGILDVEEMIERTGRRLQEEGFAEVNRYLEAVNPFNVATVISTAAGKDIHPFGTGADKLNLRFRELEVRKVWRAQKNDRTEYILIRVRDVRGNEIEMRLFQEVDEYALLNIGDKVTIVAEPIMRKSPLEYGMLVNMRPLPGDEENPIEVETPVGVKTCGTLDIVSIKLEKLKEI